MNIKVNTVKAGRHYRVTHGDGAKLIFMLDAESRMVVIYTPTRNLGGWNVDRFGGALNPASIRTFLTSTE